MAHTHFTSHLRRFFPDLQEAAIEAGTVRELIQRLDADYPGLAAYIVDERGALRQHVNIFVDGAVIRDRQRLSDALSSTSDVHILQALSGG